MARITAVLASALALLSLASCAPGVVVPRPNAEPSRPVPLPELSTIRIPVTIDLAATLAKAESAVPRQFKPSSDWMVVDRNAVGDLGIRFEATRDPLHLELDGRRLVAVSRVRYWIEVAQRVTRPLVGGSFWQPLGSCGRGGEPLREVVVGLATEIGHTANWQLTSKTTVLAPSFTNQCRMTFLKVNVTDRVAGAFSQALARAAATVDQQIASHANLRPMVERAWKQLQDPVKLTEEFALLLNPTGAGIIGLEGSGRSITAVIGIVARPAVSAAGAGGGRTTLATLPKGTLPEGFHVTVDGELTFAELNRQLARRLVSTRQVVNGRSITFTSAEAYGSGDRIVFGVGLAGDITGTVYFVGTPRYDPTSATLSVADLDYSLESKEALLKVADWLYHEGFRRSIAEQARWGLERGIADIRERLEKAFNREIAPGVRSVGSISTVRPTGVYVTPTSLRARVTVDGSLRLDVR